MEVQYICPTAYDSSVYLVNGKVLIDAGMSSDLIIKQLEKYIKLTDLKLIILTHCHYDHTAAAAAIAEKSGAKVGVHKSDLEGVNDEYLSVSVLFGESAPAVKPTIIYEEGDKIDIGNGEYLEVIHTPGHSKGSQAPGSPHLLCRRSQCAVGLSQRHDLGAGVCRLWRQ